MAVGATVDHAERSFGVRVTQDCVRCVSQAGELGSRSHRAEYESGHAVAAWSHLVRYFTGESSAFFPRVRGSGERCRSRRGWAGCNRRWLVSTASAPAAKYARWMSLSTSGRVSLRISLHPSRPRKSVQGEVRGLQHGAHRSVADDNALFQRIKQGRVKWGRHAVQSSGRTDKLWP